MKTKILVTGGQGYIGSHTVVQLIDKGYEPIIIDNLSNSNLKVLDRIEKITGIRPSFKKVEMCNYDEMVAFFSEFNGISAAIHFAAFLQVNESVEKPLMYYNNNLNSTINLLKCMQQFDVQNVVFSSSCTVYGNPDKLPVDENAQLKPAASPYGNTKRICEEILHDASKATSIRTISLRYFNPIGAHDSALIGEVQHGVPHHLIPYVTETAFGKREVLNVFGGDYNTPDGTCIRDYIHVVDLANAHISAIERLIHMKSREKYEVFNIGTGVGYSVLDIIKAFEEANNIRINYRIAPRREGDVEAIYADTSIANKALGWKAERGLHDMMQSAWNWENSFNKNPL
ncbi:MAG: UDP-glucose 4-epimerase GalE [Bacteroidales bacterium]|nr:UDP-glucose 4-epimerase GalE [Bacteroidales bacterium]